jgi:hypothetical protein
MTMNNDVKFIKGQGGLVRPLPGRDHYSGLAYYVGDDIAAPSGWVHGEPRQVFSLADLESKNIKADTGDYAVLHYHVKEFFRLNPGASLWLVLQQLPAMGNPDFAEVDELMNESSDIRQIGVYIPMAFATTQVSALQAKAAALEASHKPVQLLMQALHASIDVSTLDDLRELTAPKVSVCLGQDTTDEVEALVDTETAPGCLGTALGVVSRSQVNESIGWVGKFDLAGSGAWDIPALCDGTLIKTLTNSQIDTLNEKGYLVVVKRVGLSGSWFYDSPTSVAATSDYAYIENNRTIDKAIRGMYSYLLPEINSPVQVSSDGKLRPDFVKYMESLSMKALTEMQRNGEISDFAVTINHEQNVLSTSKLEVSVVLIPVGVSRQIVVTVGFGLSLT